MDNQSTETGLDKVIKVIKIMSQLVWLAIGVITLIATFQLYSLAKSGQLMTKIQDTVSGAVSDQVKNSASSSGLSASQIQQLQQLKQ